MSEFRRRAIVVLLFLAGLINYLDRATLAVALPIISVQLGLGAPAKGVLLSAFFWSYALMQVPMGWLVDRTSLRWLFACAFAMWSVACGLTGFASSLTALLVLRVCLGIGESVYLPAASKVISQLFSRQERGFASGIVDSGTRAGLAVGTPLAAGIVAMYGWPSMFVIVGFSSLVWLIPWIALFPSKINSTPRHIHSRDRLAPAEDKQLGRHRFDLSSVSRDLIGLCIGHFCFGYYFYVLLTWLPDYLVKVRGMSVLMAGVSAALPFGVFTICEPLGGWIADRMVRRGWNETRVRKGIVTLAYSSGLFLIPAVLVEKPVLAIGLLTAASLVGLSCGNLLALIQGLAPARNVGLWAGTVNFIANIPGIIAPIAMGLLINATGSYIPGFVVSSAILLVGILSYWMIVGELQQEETSVQPRERVF